MIKIERMETGEPKTGGPTTAKGQIDETRCKDCLYQALCRAFAGSLTWAKPDDIYSKERRTVEPTKEN